MLPAAKLSCRPVVLAMQTLQEGRGAQYLLGPRGCDLGARVHGLEFRVLEFRFLFIQGGVKIRVPFQVPIIIQHLLFRVPKKGP